MCCSCLANVVQFTVMTIAYRPEFARIPDKDGKPVGTDAALLLSQAVWLSENRANEEGWFEWTIAQCEEQTGLTRRQQQRLFPLLESLGLIQSDRQGENGARHIQFCEGKAPNVQTGKHQTCKPELENEKGKHQTCKPESTKRVNRKAPNVQTETPLFPIKDTKNRRENIPPISPRSAVSRNGFLAPSLEEASEFVCTEGGGSKDDAADFFDHYSANGWLVGGKTPMKDWRAAARKWLRTARKWEAENAARGSPSQQNGRPPPKTPEQRSQENREFLQKFAREKGFDYG